GPRLRQRRGARGPAGWLRGDARAPPARAARPQRRDGAAECQAPRRGAADPRGGEGTGAGQGAPGRASPEGWPEGQRLE
ncbi:unnamed protein product, partial [Prorocentrum cordatum]